MMVSLPRVRGMPPHRRASATRDSVCCEWQSNFSTPSEDGFRLVKRGAPAQELREGPRSPDLTIGGDL